MSFETSGNNNVDAARARDDKEALRRMGAKGGKRTAFNRFIDTLKKKERADEVVAQEWDLIKGLPDDELEGMHLGQRQ
jgi:hypothetical protein